MLKENLVSTVASLNSQQRAKDGSGGDPFMVLMRFLGQVRGAGGYEPSALVHRACFKHLFFCSFGSRHRRTRRRLRDWAWTALLLVKMLCWQASGWTAAVLSCR